MRNYFEQHLEKWMEPKVAQLGADHDIDDVITAGRRALPRFGIAALLPADTGSPA